MSIIGFKDIPDEIKINIFKNLSIETFIQDYFNLKDYKNLIDYIINKYNYQARVFDLKIKIPGNYIIERKVKGNIKRQIVTIDDKYTTKNNNITYSFYYGIFGFHEGFAKYETIKHLTLEEKNKCKSGHYWKLPQQFHQSGLD